jgi:hypothetical protein
MENKQQDQKSKLESEYLDSLTEKERVSYEIAKEHLGMSFQLDKSIGFIRWLKTKAITVPSS